MTTPTPPTVHQHHAERKNVPSLVLVNTGDGKGKSTAAFGVVLRATARQWRCAVIQFIKSGDWRTGEEQLCRELGVDWWSLGDGFTWDNKDNLDRSALLAKEAWNAAEAKLRSGDYDLVVLDEVTYPLNWGWIDPGRVYAAIRERAAETNVVCTGRDAPQPLVELADTVTEMRNVKHAYDQGVLARRGIDY